MIARTRLTVVTALAVCVLSGMMHAYTVVPGNSQNPTSTFTFPLASFIARPDGRIFVSADQDGVGDFAISYFQLAVTAFQPVAHEEVTYNGVLGPNPLFDKRVQFLGLIESDGGGLAAVLNDASATVYFIDSMPKVVVSFEGVRDAAGVVSSGIIGVEGSTKGRAFLAVKPASGVFGDDNSGINAVATARTKVVDGEQEAPRLTLMSLPRAEQFDKNAPYLGINAPLTTLEAPVPMTWNTDLDFLYVGAGNVVAGAAGDGACSIALGINNQFAINSFRLRSFFDVTTDFTGLTNNTIIVAGPNEQLSVHYLKGLLTSTNKNCLIVVGGNGAPEATRRSVYAIPLVPSGNFKGLVANKFDTSKQAFNVAQMVTNSDPQARVGGGDLPAGDIVNLSVRLETVFVTVATGEHPGVYYSHPLFDSRGEIKAWTDWARATETTQSAFASSLELSGDTSFILTSDDPDGANIPNTVVRSMWGQGTDVSFAPAVTLLNSYFPSNDTLTTGGIQQAYNFADTVAGLDAVSILATLGHDRIALVQTGIRDDGVVTPTPGSAFISLNNENGTIETTPTDQTILMVQGGELAHVGPLTTLAFAHSDTHNDTWICVAGSFGVAVLQHEDGTGCGAAIGANFNGITQGMTFTRFGDYSFVRKIVADGDSLYIVTDTRLDRVILAADIQQSTIRTIAEVPLNGLLGQYDVFIDCVISNSLGLLATSSQLVRTADGSRVTDALPLWQNLPIPEGEVPVMALYAATTTHNDADLARGIGGHLYVLTGNAYRNLSLINRFAIAGLEEGAVVTPDTVQPFASDMFVPETLSYFIDYGEAKNRYATDGASTFAVHNRHGSTPTTVVVPTFTIPNAYPRSGSKFIGVKSHFINTSVPNHACIASLVRNSASGAWLLAGTMGMRVLE